MVECGINIRLLRVIKVLGRVFLSPFFRLDVQGVDNLPQRNAFILLPKHQRWEDIPLLGLATPRSLYYVAKYELFKNPLSNWFLRSLGGIPLNRQRPFESRGSLRSIGALLNKGEGVVVFPEGTYYVNRMGPGHVGLVRHIFSRFALPFIPVGMHYSRKGLRTIVRINFGPTLYIDPASSPHSFLGRLMQEIATLSGLGG